ncbi:hypothetical protein PGIGA_G00030460 [Pangasianodon gigas]|uniref:Uncharacterized protein n=1 Tax=Pangasianodon gigas TaxID=30993 RepID=A0ACC5WXY0_PANGG|nr:hypothetical protein [Pangasianodon gigas]
MHHCVYLRICVVKYPMFMQSTIKQRKRMRMRQWWSLNVNQNHVVLNVSGDSGRSKTVNLRDVVFLPALKM